MLGKNSSSLLQQLPGTEGASGAEAGSQAKVRSEINELGKGNREAERKKNKEINHRQSFQDGREGEGAS